MQQSSSNLRARPGLRVLDWSEDRSAQGIPGHEIATLFSLIVGNDDDPGAVRFVHSRMEPNSVPRLWHSHPGWTATIILEGSIEIEGVPFTAGQLVVVAPNVAYGPLQPGPNGAAFIEIFADAAATETAWDEDDPRIPEYRRYGWIA